MSSMDVAYRAAIAEHANLRRKADRMGPIWLALDESRSRRLPLAGRVVGKAVALKSAISATLTTAPRSGSFAECQAAQELS